MSPALMNKFSMWQRLSKLSLVIERWLLSLLVRPQLLGHQQLLDQLPGLRDTKICYALQTYSRTELALLEQACLKLGLPRPAQGIAMDALNEPYALVTPADRPDKTRHGNNTSRLQRLQDALQQNHHLDVVLLPVAVYWGRKVVKKSFRQLAFGGYWRTTGYWQRFHAIAFNRKHICLQYSQPLSIRTIAGDQLGNSQVNRKLHRVLRVHFHRLRLATLGPDLSHRRVLIDQVLASHSVHQAIKKLAQKTSKKPAYFRKQAREYAFEIASHRSYNAIRLVEILVDWFWRKIYDGVEIHGADKIRPISESHTIIYLPCHRSYVDSILLPHVIFKSGLSLPHIATGSNLDLPIVGAMMRRCCSFFIRRSFVNALYAAVFQEYLYLMFQHGHSIGFFMEGGRTRTGLMLAPKRGMLTMMLESYLKGGSKPIAFIPVYLGHEKIMEESAYLRELKGASKDKESFIGFMGALRQRLRSYYGKAYANFGEPVELKKFLQQEQLTSDKQSNKLIAQASNNLGALMSSRINSAVTILEVNLVCVCLAVENSQHISQNHLQQQLQLITRIIKSVPISNYMICTETDPATMIARAKSLGTLSCDPDSPGVLLFNSQTNPMINWYSNNIIHVLIVPALICLIWDRTDKPSQSKVLKCCQTLYPFLKNEYYLPWSDSQLNTILSQYNSVLEQVKILQTKGTGLAKNTELNATKNRELLAVIGSNTMSRYLIAIEAFEKEPDNTIKIDTLITLSILQAKQMKSKGRVLGPEFFDRAVCLSFIQKLIQTNVLKTSDTGLLLAGKAYTKFKQLLQQVV